jgi:putrescine transport system ATP-binding protein
MAADSPSSSDAIVIRDLSKRFGAVTVLEGINLSIRKGEFFSLLGPSGSGKTTLMRIIAGFEEPNSGSVRIDGEEMAGVPPHLRPVNMMFQSYALFPHLTVAGNIAFGLRQQRLDRDVIEARTEAMLKLVQLDALGHRKPHQLSGGQRQRVALARALARGPKVLLLDEPLGALDKRLRQETQAELKRIQLSTGTTFVVVTHDQEEAMALSDRMAIMMEGRIIQVDAPGTVYDRPVNRHVAAFVGDVNLFPASAVALPDGSLLVSANGIDGKVALTGSAVSPGDACCLVLRPEHMRLAASQNLSADHWMSCRVEDRAHLGAQVAYRLRIANGQIVLAQVPAQSPDAGHLPGADILVGFRSADARLLGD